MRSIAIVGAGQAGLLLAHALRKNNYNVTLFTDRSAEQIYHGRITSSQGVFGSALEIEKFWALNFWDDTCPKNESVSFTLSNPTSNQKVIEWKGIPNKPFQSVDQRLKFSRWLTELEKAGGKIVHSMVTSSALDEIAANHDLTIVASGKGDLGKIFMRDVEQSRFTQPMRNLACLYVHGMQPISNTPGVRANIIPGIGEYFTMPGLTLSGACEMMLFEAVPGSPFDCWDSKAKPDEQLKCGLNLLQKYVPWEAERCSQVELTDQQATLTGAFIPEIRHPIASTNSGHYVLGIADAIVLNDPIAGQGANNAIKFTEIYLNRILENQNNVFNYQWMLNTFEEAWEYSGKWSTLWSNMLLQAPPDHVIALLSAASEMPTIANTLANAFDQPRTLFPWIEQSQTTTSLIQEAKIDHDKSIYVC